MALAIVFAIAYVLAATLGVWKMLQAREMLRHSWSALALVAVVASVLSVAGVQAIHGVRREVHQLSIVDGEAGELRANATSYFGLRTSIHSRVDVWLPEDHVLERKPERTVCSLRPMPSWRHATGSETGYTDPARYWLKPATAEIHGVPVRATLKEFEGRWRGELPGTLEASLVTRRVPAVEGATGSDYVLSRDSWIQNNLGVDLKECYLLLAEYDAFAPQSFRTVAAQRSIRGLIRALPLGELADGERVTLFDRLYLDDGGNYLPYSDRRKRGLEAMQRTWGRPFAPAGQGGAFGGGDAGPNYALATYENAALLMTVLADINPMAFKGSVFGGYPVFSRARCRQLDISSHLKRRTAIFVGFSEEAGPVRLCVRTGNREYTSAEPKKAGTVYRFTVPVRAPAGAGGGA